MRCQRYKNDILVRLGIGSEGIKILRRSMSFFKYVEIGKIVVELYVLCFKEIIFVENIFFIFKSRVRQKYFVNDKMYIYMIYKIYILIVVLVIFENYLGELY